MTYSTLASIVKYPFSSSQAGPKGKFGFFTSEKEVFERIAAELGMIQLGPERYARHPLVYLVEASDDICYQVMDIEDGHKLKIISTEETLELLLAFFDDERQAHMREVMTHVADPNEQVGYLRSCTVGLLVQECAQTFVDHEDEIMAGTFQGVAHRPCVASGYRGLPTL